MKEIKAYVQKDCLNDLVDTLESEGAPGITVVEVHPVGYGYDPQYFGFDCKNTMRRYSGIRIVKLEVVCPDGDLDRLVNVIQRVCCTGAQGDGWIFVTEVQKAIRIRDGALGEVPLLEARTQSKPRNDFHERE